MTSWRGFGVFLVFLVFGGLAAVWPWGARADEARAWHLEVEALTDVPLQVGGQVSAALPYGVRVSTALGVMPEAYVQTINGVVTAFGGYSEQTGDLIAQVLKDSLVWRLQAGWQPWEGTGFYFEAGYTLVTLGGDLTGQEAIAAATGRQPPQDGAGARVSYEAASTLHLLGGEVGWRWLVWDERVTLRASLGFVGTVAASTQVKPTEEARSAQVRAAQAQFSTFLSDYLDDVYTSYVFSPTVGVAVGWRLF